MRPSRYEAGNHHKKLLAEALHALEEERGRVARELHDISSKLNAVALNCHLLQLPHLSKSELSERTSAIIDITAEVLDNTRSMGRHLLSPVLDKFGLDAGLQELCSEYATDRLEVTYETGLCFENLDKSKQLHLFRIIEELLRKSTADEKTSAISILFEESDGQQWCRYTDNRSQAIVGLESIESKISLFLNGKLTVKSTSAGTKLAFNF